MKAHHSESKFLRRTLLANAGFSTLSGIMLVVVAKPISALLGLSMPIIVVGVGISLLIYAACLFRSAKREPINFTEASLAVL